MPPPTEPAGAAARTSVDRRREDTMPRRLVAALIAIFVATSAAMAAETNPSAAEKMT
jgi:hypothetical protein